MLMISVIIFFTIQSFNDKYPYYDILVIYMMRIKHKMLLLNNAINFYYIVYQCHQLVVYSVHSLHVRQKIYINTQNTPYPISVKCNENIDG